VVSIRDRLISARFAGVYRQLTLLPARLIRSAEPSTSAVIAAAVRRLGSFGVTTVVIQATADEPDLDGFIAFLGHEVRPLLS
jgi:hypothetical protein